jgi:hypothetical protein
MGPFIAVYNHYYVETYKLQICHDVTSPPTHTNPANNKQQLVISIEAALPHPHIS